MGLVGSHGGRHHGTTATSGSTTGETASGHQTYSRLAAVSRSSRSAVASGSPRGPDNAVLSTHCRRTIARHKGDYSLPVWREATSSGNLTSGTRMTRRFASTVSLCALLAGSVAMSGSAATQDNPPIRLLPTDPEAARVRVLQNAFDNHPAGDARARDYAELKTIVRDFVVRQLNAAPAISDETLREQLRKVVGRFWAERPDGGLYVKSDASWGPRSKQRVWAIAYVVWLGTHGPGGTGVVVDCYVWEDGQTRFAERRDSDFSGYSLYVDWLAIGPPRIGLLAYGRMSGSNGLGAWKAFVYFCDLQGVHAVWQTPVVSGLTAVARDDLIALKYAHPQKGAASSAAAWTYEVYAVRQLGVETPGVTLMSRRTTKR